MIEVVDGWFFLVSLSLSSLSLSVCVCVCVCVCVQAVWQVEFSFSKENIIKRTGVSH